MGPRPAFSSNGSLGKKQKTNKKKRAIGGEVVCSRLIFSGVYTAARNLPPSDATFLLSTICHPTPFSSSSALEKSLRAALSSTV